MLIFKTLNSLGSTVLNVSVNTVADRFELHRALLGNANKQINIMQEISTKLALLILYHVIEEDFLRIKAICR